MAMADDFAEYLRGRELLGSDVALPGEAGPPSDGSHLHGPEKPLRKLWELTDLTAQQFAAEVAQFCGLPQVALPEMLAGTALVKQFARRFLREMMVFPYQLEDGKSVLAVADPGDTAAVRAAEIVLGEGIEIKVASFEDIATALNQRLGEDEVSAGNGESAAVREDDIESLRDLASGAPVVRAVNDLFERAVELRASDIHIEPFKNGLVVRLRIDGLLRTVAAPADALPQALISRVKILAGLNIAERRLPQDGAARLRIARADVDIRVAIMPTQHGESAVIRLLMKDRGLLAIEKLGFAPPDEAKLRRLLTLPHGMIVVTGPTGSGKTTTLATVLSILNESTRKILTIEDPVEYEIQGISQSQAKP